MYKIIKFAASKTERLIMNDWIKLSIPHLAGNENKYASEAIESTWIVPLGPYVDRFEQMLARYLDATDVVALSSGTAAIHLALAMLGVGKGDEVICQSMTFSASANPIVYLGANPVFVDSEPGTWNMDPRRLEEAIEDRIKVTGRKPKAIIPVHLYGMPAHMDEIMEISRSYDIPVMEDAAEALGSEYSGRKCGTIGRYGVLSFNGNKMITTSGGGALICPDAETAARVKFLSTQARENRPYYYHETIGYNYRLSNVSAAIGCAQAEMLAERVTRRREIHRMYCEAFADFDCITMHENPTSEFNSNFWLSAIQITSSTGITPDNVRLQLMDERIETRLVWRPMHMQPVFEGCPCYGGDVSRRLFDNGLCLPSSSTMTDSDVARVAERIKAILKR